MILNTILPRLQRVRSTGNGSYRALCPAHADSDPSLTISQADGRLLLHCFAGCPTEEVVKALGVTMRDLFPQDEGRHATALSASTLRGPAAGVTVERLCAARGLDEQFVGEHLGWEDRPSPWTGEPAIIMPYRREDGTLFRSRWRLRLEKGSRGNERFAWGKGAEGTIPYGLSNLAVCREKGFAIWAEGETDTACLLQHDFPALGVPGASSYKPEWAEYTRGLRNYVIQEPDQGGRTIVATTAKSIPDLQVITLPDGYKDVCDYALALRVEFPRRFREMLDEAEIVAVERGPTTSGDTGIVSLRLMADVKAETVGWLWEPYIPESKTTLLEGDPGIGKSWVSLALATAVSLGQGLPGQAAQTPASVIIASAEDGLGDTIRPRLDAMGADVKRIHAIDGPLTLDAGGLLNLELYIERVSPRLVVLDPLVAYLGREIDIHRANETRQIMAQLARIAQQHAVSILAVRHLTKASASKALYRGIGSIDFTASCRSVLMAGCDPEDPQRRAIVHIKSNLAPMGPAVGYEVRAGAFCWTGPSSLTVSDILAADHGDLPSALDLATAFLRDELADGAVPARQVYRDAQDLGITKRTLDRAKADLGVVTQRQGNVGSRGGGGWVWQLACHDDTPDGENRSRDD